ncbi:MAG: hypothetical protein H0X37_11650 [Herpetosiphonaceae bacterium]|nr:hypothetical protein [Herpetosiphonaceae bacterium]
MYARRNWLGYLAIGLGLVALVVSLSGRMDGPRGGMQTAGGYGRRNGPAAVAPDVQPPTAAVPAAPNGAQGNAGQGAVNPRLGAGRGPIGDVGRSPFGHPFGGVVPLVGGLFVIGLGLALFVAPGRRGRRGGHQGGPGAGQLVSGEQDWQSVAAVYPSAAPQPQPAAPAVAPAPPQTPPASAHTGETTRLYDF